MSRGILPVFEAVENIEAAEALSEPFLRPEDYTVLPEDDLGKVEPIAVGVAYISDDGEVEYGFALAEETDRPLAAVQEFSGGYDRTVGYEHAVEARVKSQNQANVVAANSDWRRIAIEKTQARGLKTISGFAVFASGVESSELSSGFVVTKKVFEELPLDLREDWVDTVNRGEVNELEARLSGQISAAGIRKIGEGVMVNDRSTQMFGVAIGALLLPEPRTAMRAVADDPRVGGFLNLSRKERRRLIKEEGKAD